MPAPTGPLSKQRWRALRRLAGLALLLPLLFVLALLWLIHSQAGLHVTLALAQQLAGERLLIEQATGTLAGGLRLGRLHYRDSSLEIDALDLALNWDAKAMLRKRLLLRSVSAETLKVATPASPDPSTLPVDLLLPLSVGLERLRIERVFVAKLRADGGTAQPLEFNGVEAAADSDGRHHRLRFLRLGSLAGALSVSGELDAVAPFALQATALLSGRYEADDYRFAAVAFGTLARTRVALAAGGANVRGEGEATLTAFDTVPFVALKAKFSGIDPARLLPGAPRARLDVEADLRPQPAGPAQLSLAGRVLMRNAMPGPADQDGLPLTQLRSDLRWTAGRLDLSELRVDMAGGGQISGNASFDGGRLRAALAVGALDLARVVAVAKPTRLAGTVNVQADEDSQTLSARLADPRFKLALTATRRGDAVELSRLDLSAGEAALTAAGGLSLAGDRAFHVTGRLKHFDPARYASVPAMSLNAELSAQGVIRPDLRGTLRFELDDSRIQRHALAGTGRLELAPGRIERVELKLDLAGNRLDLDGAWGRSGDRLQLSLDAPQLAALGFGLAGRIAAKASIEGDLAAPAGGLRFEAEALELPGGNRLGRLVGEGELQAGADGSFRLQLDALDARLAGGGLPVLSSARIDLSGTRRAHRIAVKAAFDGDGKLAMLANGALGDALNWRGLLESLSVDGGPLKLALRAPAALQLGRNKLELGTAELALNGARLRLLETRYSAGELVLRGEASALDPGEWLRGRDAGSAVSDLRLAARWDLRLGDHAEGTAQILRESGDIGLRGERTVMLGMSLLEARASLQRDRLALALQLRGARLGEINGDASAWLAKGGSGWALSPQAPLSGTLRLRAAHLDWLARLLGQGYSSGGTAEGEVSLSGTAAAPQLAGSLSGKDLAFAAFDVGVGLDRGVMRLRFDRDVVSLDEFSFAAAKGSRPSDPRLVAAGRDTEGGRLSASGRYRYATGKGELSVSAQRLALIQHADRWLALSGEAALAIAGESLSLKGALTADGGYWKLADADRPRLSDDVVIVGRKAAAPAALAVAVALDVDLGQRFYLVGRGLDTRLTGKLRIAAAPGAALSARGGVQTRGGTFDAYGRTLAVERGIVTFQGPLEDPALNVLALRKNSAVEAGVEILGTAQRPRIRLVSEPDVPDAEKLSWIVLGRGQDDTVGDDRGVLVSAANAILGGPSGGGISRRLATSLGVDEIGLASGNSAVGGSQLPRRTVAGGSTQSGEQLGQQFVTIGKRLSNNAYLSYEHGLAGATGVVKLTVGLGRRVSLVGRAGSDSALDLLYQFSFD